MASPPRSHEGCSGMTIIREAILPAPPSVNETYRNATPADIAAGSRGRRKTAVYASWLRSAGFLLNSSRLGEHEGPVSVTIRVGKVNQARDLDNFCKATMDLLVKHQVIRSDNLTCVHGVQILRAFEGVPAGHVAVSLSPSISVEVGVLR